MWHILKQYYNMKRKTTLRIMLVTLLLLLPPSLMAGSTPTRVLSQQHAAHLLQQFSQPLNDPPCTLSLPYSTGFENDVSNQAPSCWTTLLGEAYPSTLSTMPTAATRCWPSIQPLARPVLPLRAFHCR